MFPWLFLIAVIQIQKISNKKKTVELHAACICMERSLPGIIMGIITSADALYYPIILLIVTYLARGTRYSRPYLLIIYLHIIGKLLIN